MHFSVFFPPGADDGDAETQSVPVIYFLSGLTCTDENFLQKAGAPRAAAEHGVALVCPDTSPRGLGVPGEDESWDFGTGAGFYLNATQKGWEGYRMYDYVLSELPGVLPLLSQTLDVTNVSTALCCCLCVPRGDHSTVLLN